MINAYHRENDLYSISRVNAEQPLPENTLWLDLVDLDEQENEWLEKECPGFIYDDDELHEIEASSRFFESETGFHIRSLFPHQSGQELKNINIAFNLRDDQLITLQDEPTALFRLMRNYLKLQVVKARTPMDIVIALFDAKVEFLADTLEEVYENLEAISRHALSDEANDVDELLKNITLQEDINGKARLNLLDSQRCLRYLLKSCRHKLDDGQIDEIRDILRDIDSLTPHTGFLFEKINFLMEATMGFINLEQNNIIKIFSVAAVMFLPPTLIASIYGMNFKVMPELATSWGYPMALVLMVSSALGTYLFFKRKGWL
ncbi:magnesium and cobalt transport protein CorA [Endozoicomonas sp. OPT23]|uniref:magnesium/cobalt transporter CorA n=1 Tax=Endozoicomonas sp. OPT23 TaxID=2072845 RepID=UPI00129A99F5|nr:magnesium/cobalt transporter CorA [Endozoicomonas sp. OPT23]MRI34962.1 magnesium and cobalt transport protein CorA [Endozoicomonas sp. OPT23]